MKILCWNDFFMSLVVPSKRPILRRVHQHLQEIKKINVVLMQFPGNGWFFFQILQLFKQMRGKACMWGLDCARISPEKRVSWWRKSSDDLTRASSAWEKYSDLNEFLQSRDKSCRIIEKSIIFFPWNPGSQNIWPIENWVIN